MSDGITDVGAEAPPRPNETPKLFIHFILYKPPTVSQPGNSTNVGSTSDTHSPFVSLSISQNITAEEARSIVEMVGSARTIVVEVEQGDGKPYVHPFLVAR